jgi:hypothetical protein
METALSIAFIVVILFVAFMFGRYSQRKDATHDVSWRCTHADCQFSVATTGYDLRLINNIIDIHRSSHVHH